MSRFSQFLARATGLFTTNETSQGSALSVPGLSPSGFSVRTPALVLDWGNLYTRFSQNGDLVYNQPNCYLQDQSTQSVLAIGVIAYQLKDKQPPGTELIFPIQHGAIYHQAQARQYLQALLAEQGFTQRWPLLARASLTAVVPAGLNNLEKQILTEVAYDLGLKPVNIITKSQAILNYLSTALRAGDSTGSLKRGNGATQANTATNITQPSSAYSLVIIDIGYQLTEVGVVVDGKLVKQDSLAWGGKDVTRAVEQVIVQRYGLKVGWHWLERVKFHLPDLLVGHEVEVRENGQVEASTSKAARPARRINIRGVNTTDNLAVTQTVRSKDFQATVQQLADQLVAKIKLVLQQVDPGVIVEALDNGIYLTGGGSLLPGLEQYLAAQLKTQVRTSQQPYVTTILGSGG